MTKPLPTARAGDAQRRQAESKSSSIIMWATLSLDGLVEAHARAVALASDDIDALRERACNHADMIRDIAIFRFGRQAWIERLGA